MLAATSVTATDGSASEGGFANSDSPVVLASNVLAMIQKSKVGSFISIYLSSNESSSNNSQYKYWCRGRI